MPAAPPVVRQPVMSRLRRLDGQRRTFTRAFRGKPLPKRKGLPAKSPGEDQPLWAQIGDIHHASRSRTSTACQLDTWLTPNKLEAL
ncbi:hypothetical protein MUA04_03065 [Enterobacteriaceae bacterium H11S18]|uniref:hypothetical protein n=1 Tax=Dryocola clanedunensis TaxID=2925396 RepID=UPI0022F0D3BC|nr:hypothetical protein [Dryocola clanedunensis]MCT4709180.1 hypothetical protein [Dryocola clanedunensis]